MSWTTPKSWSTNEFVTAALLNTHLRDNLLALPHSYHLDASTGSDVTGTTGANIYSATISGNALGTLGSIHVQLHGDYVAPVVQASPTGTAFYLRVDFGGAQLAEVTFRNFTSSSTRRPWRLNLDVFNKTSTSVQFATADLVCNSASGNISGHLAQGTGAADTTINRDLVVHARWSDSGAGDYIRRLWGRTLLATN